MVAPCSVVELRTSDKHNMCSSSSSNNNNNNFNDTSSKNNNDRAISSCLLTRSFNRSSMSPLQVDMAAAQSRLQELCEAASKWTRTPQPASHLKLALQCGGSDAFSGVSGNPLAGHLAKILIQVILGWWWRWWWSP